jgi:thiosulfate/3-mercaptopyruvate sulfurtransferase
MPTSDPQLIVTTDWLADHLNAPDVKVLDGSWHMPDTGRNGRAEYEAGHIPGALFFDIDEISDTQSALPHMAPPVEKFISRVRAMGIGDGHRVVVLDGGLPKWKADGYEVEDMPPIARDRHFTARRDATLVRDVTQVAAAAKLGDEQIIDARSPGRFRGEEPEPRPGLRSGHIPGSLNVYFRDLFNADNTMKDEAAMKAVFEAAGVDLSRPVISSCGSGVTACILDLALERLGHRRHSVYDGSWSEWGMYPDLKVETG